MDETVDMGPVISKAAMDKINNYIDIGVKEGARLLYKGECIQKTDIMCRLLYLLM